tara:strand:+ start:509 stop:634 length:126 start_codon:yes stop_codon:yes gene_type:complete
MCIFRKARKLSKLKSIARPQKKKNPIDVAILQRFARKQEED